MLADLTLSSCQIGLDDKDKLVRYVPGTPQLTIALLFRLPPDR